MKNSKVIKEGVLLLGIYVALLLLSFFIPFFIMIGIVLLPVPFIVFSAKHELKESLIFVSVAVFLSLFLVVVVSLPLTVLVSSGGIVIGISIRQNISVYETWSRGTIGFIGGLLFAFLFSELALGVNWINEFNLALEESLQMSKEVIDQFGLANSTDEQFELLEEQIFRLSHLVPTGIVVVSMFLAFVSQWISFKFLNRYNNESLQFPAFRTLRFPTVILWIYFFALILTFIDLELNTFYLVIHNVFTLTGLFMVIQGLSLAFYYTHMKQRSNFLPILLIVLTIILPFFFLYLVRILGIIDLGFGLRDRLSSDGKK